MKPTPSGWSRISSALIYDDPRAAIEWLCRAFGFELRTIVETADGTLVHSEIVYGEGVLMSASGVSCARCVRTGSADAPRPR